MALNDLCVVPDSGMLFMANEAPKVLVYYIPVSNNCRLFSIYLKFILIILCY